MTAKPRVKPTPKISRTGKIPGGIDVEQLRRVIDKNTKPWAVLVTAVDPDGLSSAMGMRYILETLTGKSVTIYYAGKVGNDQSHAIFLRYELSQYVKPLAELGDRDKYHLALVDSSQIHDSRVGEMAITPVIVVDHHSDATVVKADDNFILIQPVGAAATLVVELIQALSLVQKLPDSVGTMLALGIHSDTKALAKAGLRDLQAYFWLYSQSKVAQASLEQLLQYTLPDVHFIHVQMALERRVEKNGYLITNIGYISEDSGDDVAIIADALIRKRGETLVVVFAIVEKTDKPYVRLSVRSKGASTPIHTVLERLAQGRSGYKFVGTGEGEGGAGLELNSVPWYIPETKAEVLALVAKYLQVQLFGSE